MILKTKAVHRCIRKSRKEIPYFDKVFKSITTVSGSEFARLHKLEKKLGIDIYYAHPYSSWEWAQIHKIEDWMNTLYRKPLGWRTAEECYQEELDRLLEAVWNCTNVTKLTRKKK